MESQAIAVRRPATAIRWPPYSYWGKARPRNALQLQHHSLPLHSLDVAAVGYMYLEAHPKLLDYFARRLAVSSSNARDWICFWLAVHDLGKFSLSFQNQRSDLLRQLQSRESSRAYSVRHDSLGALVWQQRLLVDEDVLSLGARASTSLSRLQPWIFAVTSHHGQPPRLDGINVVGHFEAVDVAAAAAFTREARSLLLPQDVLDAVLASGDRLKATGRHLSWWLAGVAVLADWIGSNAVRRIGWTCSTGLKPACLNL
ncbi:MAG: CRISPR-associated endonuclease Cas3'' [Pseudomonadota bacterium]|nr:CRISPR-associated endonuclease Cas3'' [Pseudomonadota bacterium]